ncbi:MAG: hypothetical protein GKS02_11155 [Alphaproteobacteria bacterium]|nr:hypothetical protein [Alphaproteobacteria bacterium]
MRSKSLAAPLAIALTIPFATVNTAEAEILPDCVRAAATANLDAKTQYQRDLRDLIVTQRPEFEALATINQDLQIGLAQSRRAKYDYLLDHDRERIDTSNGISRFSNFRWSLTENENFKADDSSYRDLEARVDGLQEQSTDHPDWPALREFFRAVLRPSPLSADLIEGLVTRQGEIAATLKNCQRE